MMEMLIKNFFYILLLNCSLFAQDYFFQNEFGKFEDAVAFKINPSGFIYIIDSGSSEIIKTDSTGKVVKYNGGYGWDEGLFDKPIDICLSGLNVYVADLNNHRIQILDSDLNFIAALNGKNDRTVNDFSEDNFFRYPVACTVSSMGDIFIADSENRRIIKFDPSGKFLLKFGDYESGKFTLKNPTKIDIGFNNILVIDETRILLFDLFGNGLVTITSELGISNLAIFNDKIIFNNKSSLFFGEITRNNLTLREIDLKGYSFESEIIQCAGYGEDLFVLLKDRIVQFKNKKG